MRRPGWSLIPTAPDGEKLPAVSHSPGEQFTFACIQNMDEFLPVVVPLRSIPRPYAASGLARRMTAKERSSRRKNGKAAGKERQSERDQLVPFFLHSLASVLAFSLSSGE